MVLVGTADVRCGNGSASTGAPADSCVLALRFSTVQPCAIHTWLPEILCGMQLDVWWEEQLVRSRQGTAKRTHMPVKPSAWTSSSLQQGCIH